MNNTLLNILPQECLGQDITKRLTLLTEVLEGDALLSDQNADAVKVLVGNGTYRCPAIEVLIAERLSAGFVIQRHELGYRINDGLFQVIREIG